MRLSRRGYYQNTNHEPRKLADKDLSDREFGIVQYSFGGREFTLGIRGGDGIENSQSTYWYEITLTLKEMRILLSRSLSSPYWHFPGGQEISGAERELWGTLFDLWEKRLKKLARKRSR